MQCTLLWLPPLSPLLSTCLLTLSSFYSSQWSEPIWLAEGAHRCERYGQWTFSQGLPPCAWKPGRWSTEQIWEGGHLVVYWWSLHQSWNGLHRISNLVRETPAQICLYYDSVDRCTVDLPCVHPSSNLRSYLMPWGVGWVIIKRLAFDFTRFICICEKQASQCASERRNRGLPLPSNICPPVLPRWSPAP